MSYCCRRSSANRLRASRSPSGAMRPLPSRKFMRLRRNAEYSTPFAFRPTRALDKAVVPSVPGERGTATTERAGLQPGQLVAAARTAEQDQELVADELATQVDEDRRSAGQARAVLLAAAGRRAFEPQAVRRHAAQDLGAAAAKRVALTGRGSTVFGSKRFRKEQCRPERRSARSINVCERMDEPWRLPAEVMCRVQREKTWYSGQRGWILSPCQGQNGNPG